VELGCPVIDEHVVEWLWKRMGESYSEGYQQGVADEALANEYKKEKT
jgi:hypothetical protein